MRDTLRQATDHDPERVSRVPSAQAPRMAGVVFAKLFPNSAEPARGIFVAEQVRATHKAVDWAVVAPVPWIPRLLAGAFGKPYVAGDGRLERVQVLHPRYPVLPRRWLYSTVAPLIAVTARRSFERACATVDATFVHAHDLYPSGAAARRLCERAGLPYVLTVHGSDLYSNLDNPLWRAEIREAAHGARAVICVGRRLARDCTAKLGVPASRTVVIPDTYDAARFTFVERRGGRLTAGETSDSPRAIRLVSVGRLSHEKGHDVLLRALADVRSSGLDATLVLVGDGPERARLESLRESLGLMEAVEFVGLLAHERLPEAYAAADAFVLPSRAEGFGVALVEAMATGLPAVATRSGGPEDIVLPDDGILVPADDAPALADGIAAVIENRARYDPRAIASRTYQRFSPRAVGARLVRFYAEALAGEPLSGAVDAPPTGAPDVPAPGAAEELQSGATDTPGPGAAHGGGEQ